MIEDSYPWLSSSSLSFRFPRFVAIEMRLGAGRRAGNRLVVDQYFSGRDVNVWPCLRSQTSWALVYRHAHLWQLRQAIGDFNPRRQPPIVFKSGRWLRNRDQQSPFPPPSIFLPFSLSPPLWSLDPLLLCRPSSHGALKCRVPKDPISGRMLPNTATFSIWHNWAAP